MRNKQRGAFSVELALILAFVASFFALQVNFVIATSNKGQMDRLAYSLVSVLSERRELFRDEGNICQLPKDCEELVEEFYDIGLSAMRRMSNVFDSDRFGIRIEELIIYPGGKINWVRQRGYVGCNFVPLDNVPEIIPTTSRNRKLPVYQVSLCYRTPFNILGATRGELVNVVSSAFSFARI
ncbi:tight adherence pilus pseudopilin TadF [Vibrio nigripulchritudo]|uniref:tight adherence pilus pseudopilin TadF n=1 Tax=Vibrio nigripulchritudo TaxID=28173 RepID=UPI002492659F|nr:tight adherence pilus pseudopilin TadF [Vibrio nigripulchritudo]BDU36998.1 pilus assembly protein TadF [Vibrio nigripulchritudo]BDU42708.1 pilus assembly protein TadF [Vibrio nigripulchritudo]